jgi:hypothetical protein
MPWLYSKPAVVVMSIGSGHLASIMLAKRTASESDASVVPASPPPRPAAPASVALPPLPEPPLLVAPPWVVVPPEIATPPAPVVPPLLMEPPRPPTVAEEVSVLLDPPWVPPVRVAPSLAVTPPAPAPPLAAAPPAPPLAAPPVPLEIEVPPWPPRLLLPPFGDAPPVPDDPPVCVLLEPLCLPRATAASGEELSDVQAATPEASGKQSKIVPSAVGSDTPPTRGPLAGRRSPG